MAVHTVTMLPVRQRSPWGSVAMALLSLVVSTACSRSCLLQDVQFNDDSSASIPHDCSSLLLEPKEGADDAEWPQEFTSTIADAIAQSPFLERLKCSNLPLGDAGASAVAHLIQSHSASPLTFVELNNANITDYGAGVLGKALETSDSLAALLLPANLIADEGAFVIANALRINQNLAKLDLSHNKLSDHGAIAIVDALKAASKVTALEELALSHNHHIGDATAVRLTRTLQTNDVLRTIILFGNNITELGADAFKEMLLPNKRLRWLEFDDNAIADYHYSSWEGVRAILRSRRHGECGHADVFRSSRVITNAKPFETRANRKYRRHAFATWKADIPTDCVTINLADPPPLMQAKGTPVALLAHSLAAALAKLCPSNFQEQRGQQHRHVPKLKKLDFRNIRLGNAGLMVLATALNKVGPSRIDYIDLRDAAVDGATALTAITAITTNHELMKTLKVLYIGTDDANLVVDNPHLLDEL